MRMLAGEIFPAVTDDVRRSEIFDRICSREHAIPSIYTCIENTKWLELSVRILKEILPENEGTDQRIHLRRSNVALWRFFLAGLPAALFLALRHFPEMDGQAPRKDAPKQNSPSSRIQ